ncbi:unnamed protein product [Orchesella dallaii]|uniref:Uncharacterized protein n=1 Tax=Orchesella dallaii TaxID=48710 RepID=A0ABP1QUS4_9HEXA
MSLSMKQLKLGIKFHGERIGELVVIVLLLLLMMSDVPCMIFHGSKYLSIFHNRGNYTEKHAKRKRYESDMNDMILHSPPYVHDSAAFKRCKRNSFEPDLNQRPMDLS